jgi:hypothetical protein
VGRPWQTWPGFAVLSCRCGDGARTYEASVFGDGLEDPSQYSPRSVSIASMGPTPNAWRVLIVRSVRAAGSSMLRPIR